MVRAYTLKACVCSIDSKCFAMAGLFPAIRSTTALMARVTVIRALGVRDASDADAERLRAS
jgi:hypothetical protein